MAEGGTTADDNRLDQRLKKREYSQVLEQVLDRLFALRGEIVHGASIGGSNLSRASMTSATKFWEALVPVIVHGV